MISPRQVCVGVMALIVVTLAFGSGVAETFQKIGSAQIRAKIAGMEISDGVHSRDAFGRDGTLTSYAMGKKTFGRWRILGDELCITLARGEEACCAVWVAGAKIELRTKGSQLPIMEGELQKARP